MSIDETLQRLLSNNFHGDLDAFHRQYLSWHSRQGRPSLPFQVTFRQEPKFFDWNPAKTRQEVLTFSLVVIVQGNANQTIALPVKVYKVDHPTNGKKKRKASEVDSFLVTSTEPIVLFEDVLPVNLDCFGERVLNLFLQPKLADATEIDIEIGGIFHHQVHVPCQKTSGFNLIQKSRVHIDKHIKFLEGIGPKFVPRILECYREYSRKQLADNEMSIRDLKDLLAWAGIAASADTPAIEEIYRRGAEVISRKTKIDKTAPLSPAKLLAVLRVDSDEYVRSPLLDISPWLEFACTLVPTDARMGVRIAIRPSDLAILPSDLGTPPTMDSDTASSSEHDSPSLHPSNPFPPPPDHVNDNPLHRFPSSMAHVFSHPDPLHTDDITDKFLAPCNDDDCYNLSALTPSPSMATPPHPPSTAQGHL